MSRNGRRLNALLALLFLLSGLPQGVLVVCVAEDGHVALKIAGSPGPLDAAPAFDGTSLRGAACACGGGCGPCRDSEVGFASLPALLSATRGHGVSAPAPLAAMAFATLPPPSAALTLPRAACPIQHFFRPDLQQSVVLRI